MANHDDQELQLKLKAARLVVDPTKQYLHYRSSSRYRIVTIALIEATQEPAVVYESLDHPGLIWIRPVADFVAIVEHAGRPTPRFEAVESA